MARTNAEKRYTAVGITCRLESIDGHRGNCFEMLCEIERRKVDVSVKILV